MKIAHSLESTDIAWGGPARSVPQLALYQMKLGHQVSLYTQRPRPLYGNEDDSVNQLLSVTDDYLIRNLMRTGCTFDLLHDHGVWLPFHLSIANFCRKHTIPRLVSPRGMLEPWALQYKKWKKRIAWILFQQRILRNASALHATSTSEAEQFRKLGMSQPIFVIPNGLILPEPTGRIAPVANTTRCAVFLGRIHPVKGISLLAHAWNKLRPSGWRMRVIGPDEANHRQELVKLVKDLGLAEQWTFEPALDGHEKWKALQSSDLFVLPSYSENFGISVAEAMGCGLPVITTRGTPWKVLEEKECGWWVPADPHSLMIALKDATSRTPHSLQQMGERGRRVVEERFSWNEIASAMVEGYEWLLNKGKPPICALV